ncbi:MAG: M23 family metallopeptidase, partial [Deltaproteobacteria bacterium]|nr:M23 family metallopeptidase [Deltaproteobacteria bacterium]
MQSSPPPKKEPERRHAQVPETAWLAPVHGPISSRFGQQRETGTHEGIDVAVSVGTRVVAPQAMRVEKVGYNERSGRFVVANVMRPDGSFDDSDGYRLTFAHLSEVLIEEGDVLQRGQSFSRSGATGRVTGPHLHFRVQWVEDGLLSDDVISVDPLAVIPEEVFAGQMQPFSLGTRSTTALQKGQPINIIIAPGAGRVS